MGKNNGNGMPAYRRIQNAILKRVESGGLKPGDPVDSERELARIHGVSLMTARHALAALEQEGVVERRQGVGTFVAPPRIHFNKLVSFTDQMSVRNLSACSKILCFSQIKEPELAARLSLEPSRPLVKLERMREGGGEPFALETCYLSAEDFPDLQSATLQRGSLFSTLENHYGVELSHADEEVDATVADPRTARLLAIARGQPVLRIRQVIYSKTGKPAVYVLGLYRSDRHTLLIRRYR
jgi:GntR family transcriptional regulator